jgi:hypothetical protein
MVFGAMICNGVGAVHAHACGIVAKYASSPAFSLL